MTREIAIVLGFKLNFDQMSEELIGRVDVAVDLFNRKVVNLLIFSGGCVGDETVAEATVMKKYAEEKGVPSKGIITETQSKDTIGNAYFTRLLVGELSSIGTIRVITSCYHMKRAAFAFAKCFGNRFKLDFRSCSPFPCDTDCIEHERTSLALARNFFDGLEDGKLSIIGGRLINSHLLYKK